MNGSCQSSSSFCLGTSALVDGGAARPLWHKFETTPDERGMLSECRGTHWTTYLLEVCRGG